MVFSLNGSSLYCELNAAVPRIIEGKMADSGCKLGGNILVLYILITNREFCQEGRMTGREGGGREEEREERKEGGRKKGMKLLIQAGQAKGVSRS